MSFSLLRHKCFDLSKHLLRKDFVARTSSLNQRLVRLSDNAAAQPSRPKSIYPDEVKQKANEAWEQMSKKERLKLLVRDYGKTIIIFHVGISLISLGFFYALVSSGIDMTVVVNFFSKDTGEAFKSTLSNSSTFLVAYAVHKLFAPLRLSITIGCAPLMVKYFRRKGLIKPAIIKAVEKSN